MRVGMGRYQLFYPAWAESAARGVAHRGDSAQDWISGLAQAHGWFERVSSRACRDRIACLVTCQPVIPHSQCGTEVATKSSQRCSARRYTRSSADD